MKEIMLSRGMVAMVDDCDFEELSKHKWSIHCVRGTFYAKRATRTPEEKTILMHREIMGFPIGEEIDHRDGNGLNNTRENLRVCSPKQNRANMKRHRDSLSPFKGITKATDKTRWTARIKIGDKHLSLGCFDTARDAARAYDIAAKRYHGEFARLNFPEVK
jgi:hypothetical protein